jgi:NAD(P)-dependent dehydrogenase (short-subunit alcohol dehydrogenase family)
MRGLEGSSAIVTGAASGIGQATAMRLAEEGVVLTLGDINAEGNEATARKINENGGKAVALEMDVTRSATWKALLDTALSEHGKVDYLCNIAGIVNTKGPDNAVELDEEHWHWVIDTDLTGTWLGMKTVLPHMLENGAGSIVNISSMAALRGLADLTAYSAAKGGVIGITQQVAQQYGPEGIRVNAIAPGTIKTPILGDVDIDFSVFHIIPRLGEAHEVASMVAFLHSEDAAFLTGHTFPVDGGWNAKT